MLKILSFIRRISVRNLLGASFQAYGVLWLGVQVVDFFSKAWGDEIRQCVYLYLLLGAVWGIYRSWPTKSIHMRIIDTDVDVGLRIGDVMNFPGATIVGSNITFDTAMEDQTISKESVQGQFTNKYFPNIEALDCALDSALETISPTKELDREQKPFGKLQEYELGTVAPIERQGKKAYFVAIAELNPHRVAVSGSDRLLDLLPRMWNGIRTRGGMEHLVSPILGSGFSRLNLTRNELIKSIIRSFVAATREGKLTEKLTIAIHPDDVARQQIGWDDLHKFLEYECTYAKAFQTTSNATPVGEPV